MRGENYAEKTDGKTSFGDAERGAQTRRLLIRTLFGPRGAVIYQTDHRGRHPAGDESGGCRLVGRDSRSQRAHPVQAADLFQRKAPEGRRRRIRAVLRHYPDGNVRGRRGKSARKRGMSVYDIGGYFAYRPGKKGLGGREV